MRHGESAPGRVGEPTPKLEGHSDPALDPRGEEEARRVAERLRGASLAAVYVSPLRRTRQTAGPLVRALGMEPVVEPRIREVYLGEWEGVTFRKNTTERHPIALRMFAEQRWDVIPGAEPQQAFFGRLREAVSDIAARHPDQRVALFTHGGVIASIAHLATQSAPFAFLGADNGSLTHVVIHADRWLVRRFNDTSHLATDLDAPPTDRP
ncbi:MAG: histidine phosphatase family protein [Myxococcales bacterium]|nr:histidine phosphatase family protein [Myxococcales bacterium]